MSSQSETMMSLLKELALLKELDEKSEAKSEPEGGTTQFEARQQRRLEISDQIKALGATAD